MSSSNLFEDHELHMSFVPSLRLEKLEILAIRNDQPDTYSDVPLNASIVYFAPSHMEAYYSSICVDLEWISDH